MINFQKIRIKFHYNNVIDWDRKGQAATLQKFVKQNHQISLQFC